MKSPFTDTFILLIDNVLNTQYDNPISRKDYLTFFELFEHRISRNETESFKSVEINNHRERLKWGRVKGIWKFDIIIKTLIENNILSSTGYEPNIHSRRYSYSEAFYNALDFSSFSIVYEDINEKIYNLFKNNKLYDTSNIQYQHLKSERFTIDVDKCNDWLIESFKSNEITKDNCLLNIRRVFDIHNKDIYAVKIANGRIYTSFSSLKRELRQFCYIDNKPLFSIDLKSSQPYILASYLIKKYPHSIGVNRFYEVITEQDVYYWIMGNSSIKTREEAKTEMYRYLFKLTNRSNGIVQNIIQKDLPDLYEIICNERNLFYKNGNSLANFLQSEEADIFIPVCEAHVNEGCLSVHDSLYFIEEIRGKIEEDLNNSFKLKGFSRYKII